MLRLHVVVEVKSLIEQLSTALHAAGQLGVPVLLTAVVLQLSLGIELGATASTRELLHLVNYFDMRFQIYPLSKLLKATLLWTLQLSLAMPGHEMGLEELLCEELLSTPLNLATVANCVGGFVVPMFDMEVVAHLRAVLLPTVFHLALQLLHSMLRSLMILNIPPVPKHHLAAWLTALNYLWFLAL